MTDCIQESRGETTSNKTIKAMKIIMKDKIIVNTYYTTYKTDHNSSQDMPTTKRDISITTREDKTHTHKIDVLTNFKLE